MSYRFSYSTGFFSDLFECEPNLRFGKFSVPSLGEAAGLFELLVLRLGLGIFLT